MERYRRRAVLRGGLAVLTTVVAGCAGESREQPGDEFTTRTRTTDPSTRTTTTESRTTTKTRTTRSAWPHGSTTVRGFGVLDGGLGHEPPNQYAVVMTDDAHLDGIRRDETDRSAETLLDETDFDDYALLVAQARGPGGTLDYVVRDATWETTDRLVVRTSYEGDAGGPNWEYVLTLFARIPIPDGHKPASVTVVVENDPYEDGGTTTIRAGDLN
jgi:hypothetical protein